MMKKKHKDKLANFANWEVELQKAEDALAKELAAKGGEVDKKVAEIRAELVDAVGSYRASRERLGRLVVAYHQRFKDSKAWLQVEDALATALEYDNRKSVYNLRIATEQLMRLETISPKRYAALKRSGIVPAKMKYMPLVKGLLIGATEDETEEGAQAAFDRGYAPYMDQASTEETQKKPATKRTGDQLKEEITEKLAQMLTEIPESKWDEAIATICLEARERAHQNAESAKREAMVAPIAAPISENAVLTKPKGAPKAANSAATRINETQDGVVPTPVLPLHPWGDAPLCVIAADKDSPEKLQIGLPNDQLRSAPPQRLLIADDLCEQPITDYAKATLFRDMGRASRHTFMAHTRRPECLPQIEKKLLQGQWPSNVWIGASVESVQHVELVVALGESRVRHKWVSFLTFRSDEDLPLAMAYPELGVMLGRAVIEWVLFDYSNVTDEDEAYLVQASRDAKCAVFCSAEQFRLDFIRGKISEFAVRAHGRGPNWTAEQKTRRNLRELPPEFLRPGSLFGQ